MQAAAKSTAQKNRNLRSPALALPEFASLLYPGYEHAAHIVRLAEALAWLMATPGAALVVIMPPRHGKSLLASVLFPAWVLGNWPWLRLIAVSHGAELAHDFSRVARNLFTSPWWPFPDVALAPDRGAVGGWDVAGDRGGYTAAGVGGSIIGRGADVLIIDDAIRNRADALSANKRDSIWEWFQSTALTRLEPGGRLVLIGTRWHHDDLLGRYLSAFPNGAMVMHLPARAVGADDLLGRLEGEALWPERFDTVALATIAQRVGTQTWNAEYQGMPSEEAGAILHRTWFPRIPRPSDGILYVLQSWDTAFKIGANNDFSACTTWGITVAGCELLDAFKGQYEFPELCRVVTQAYQAWQPRHVLIEDKASGQSLLQALAAQTLRIPTVAVAVPAGSGKEERMHEVSPFVESGRIKLPAFASFVDPFLDEVTEFPFGAYDDWADSASQAWARIFAAELGAGKTESVDYRQTFRLAQQNGHTTAHRSPARTGAKPWSPNNH